jgi:hypothetical protein
MAKHIVKVVASYEQTVNMGPLVIKDFGNGSESVIDDKRTETYQRKAGDVLKFTTKKSALLFVEHAPAGHVMYVGKE